MGLVHNTNRVMYQAHFMDVTGMEIGTSNSIKEHELSVDTAPCLWNVIKHYSDVIMSATVSQITDLSIVCSIVCSGADQRKHQSSASLAFMSGIQQSPVDSTHKGPETPKKFPLDDVIMRLYDKQNIDIYRKWGNRTRFGQLDDIYRMPWYFACQLFNYLLCTLDYTFLVLKIYCYVSASRLFQESYDINLSGVNVYIYNI